MERTRIRDPLVRIFHWTLAAGFTANALFTVPEGDLHQAVGYAIMGLLAVRILWGFIGTPHARFASFPPSPGAAIGQLRDMLAQRRHAHAHAGHSPLGALMIHNLLLTIAVIVASGWMLTTSRWWGIDWVEELHEAAVTWAELSILVHIAAVVLESLRLGINLPKSMVTGYKDLPRPTRPDAGSDA
jgi:cytochrome b